MNNKYNHQNKINLLKAYWTKTLKYLEFKCSQLGYQGRDYSEHSSRRGVATHCSEVGIDDSSMQVAGNWSDPRTVKKYIDCNPRQHQRLTRGILEI